MRYKRIILFLIIVAFTLMLTGCVGESDFAAPGVTLSIGSADDPKQVSTGVQLLVLLTVLTIAPSILLMATSFTRIIIVLGMIRNAMGTPTIPPNQVLMGLALIITFFIMTPVFTQVDQQALQPFKNGEIDQTTAFKQAWEPFREFMFKQVREKDLDLFLNLSGSTRPQTLADIPNSVLLAGYVISELRAALIMSFTIYIPFLIIDLVIASVLLSMGMMMLPPSLISMPFKILLFVMVDGWYLVIKSLAMSFAS